MSEHDRDLASMDEGDVSRHQRNQALMQEAIDTVGQTSEGKDVKDVTAQLVEALAARGIHDQPPRWLDAVATELVAGGRYVEDPTTVMNDEDPGTGPR